jgi:integrase
MAQIVRRGRDKWLVRVFLGRDGATGKPAFENRTVTGTKKDAADWAYKRERDRTRTGMESLRVAVGDLLDSLTEDYRTNSKSVAWCELVVRVHLRPFFGNMRALELTTGHVRRYIAGRQAKGAANATINRELALLRRAFYLASEDTPPRVQRVPKIPSLEENNVRKGFFEHDEFLKMRAALPDYLKPVITFAYYTGCRRAEILSLQWRQVDLLERVVRLDPGTTKSGEGRMIPLAGEVYDALAMQRALRDQEHPECPWVFFHGDGEPLRDFRAAWESAAKAAGLADEAGRPTKLFHDLRRTGVRNLIRAGVPERVAMSISGHKTRSVFDRYNVVAESDLKDAARRLGEYLGKKTTESEKLSHYSHTRATGAGAATSGKPS